MNEAKTKIADMYGRLHGYTCRPLGFDDALDLGLELAALAGGPLGTAFKGLLLGNEDPIELGADDKTDDMMSQIIQGLSALPEQLIARGGSALIARVLAGVIRIGEDDQGKVKQDLSDKDDRDAAYGGGNMAEAFRAVKWVLEVNYGPFLTEVWAGVQPHLSGPESSLKPSLLTQSQENTTESKEATNAA